MRFEHSAEFECTPEQLWPFLDEPEKMKLWLKGLVEVVPTSEGPTRVGSTSVMKIQEGAKVGEYRREVIAYEPPRHVGFKLTGGSFKGTPVFADFRLESLGGRTRLDSEFQADPSGLQKLLWSGLKVVAQTQVKSFFKTLKQLVEN